MRESCMRFLSLLKKYMVCLVVRKGEDPRTSALLESKNGEDLGSNILRIAEALEGEEFQDHTCYLACNKKKCRTPARSLAPAMDRINLVECGSLRYFYLLASAGFLFTDTSFPRRFIKKQPGAGQYLARHSLQKIRQGCAGGRVFHGKCAAEFSHGRLCGLRQPFCKGDVCGCPESGAAV